MDPIRLVVPPRGTSPMGPSGAATAATDGPGGLPTRRTLPERRLAAIGAWCLLEQFGDARTRFPAGEASAHPEAGLLSLTVPIDGLIRRRDSLGNDHLVRHGGVWLSTAGLGLSVVEAGVDDPRGGRHARRLLHGVRLAAALPATARAAAPELQVIPDPPVVRTPTMRATALVGDLLGERGAASPARVPVPLVAADLALATGTERVALDPSFEHGVLLLAGELSVDGTPLRPGDLAYAPPGRERLDLATLPGCHVLLLGGTPYQEEFILWWNIVAASHEEIAAARTAWEAGLGPFDVVPVGATRAPAPPLPPGRMRPRRGSLRAGAQSKP